jgi:hypothetical protein
MTTLAFLIRCHSMNVGHAMWLNDNVGDRIHTGHDYLELLEPRQTKPMQQHPSNPPWNIIIEDRLYSFFEGQKEKLEHSMRVVLTWNWRYDLVMIRPALWVFWWSLTIAGRIRLVCDRGKCADELQELGNACKFCSRFWSSVWSCGRSRLTQPSWQRKHQGSHELGNAIGSGSGLSITSVPIYCVMSGWVCVIVDFLLLSFKLEAHSHWSLWK